VYAWTFLVPAVAVLIEAVRGELPGITATIGIAVVIIGVAIVNHPRAEAPEPDRTEVSPLPAGQTTPPTSYPA
jgi:drug/metabolite transporter (DMT)-like permease